MKKLKERGHKPIMTEFNFKTMIVKKKNYLMTISLNDFKQYAIISFA